MWRRLYEYGGVLADKGANLAGNPFAIVVLAVVCIAWIAGGYGVDTLTLLLSILAITLTQMVLNQQRRHEAALHLKIDELVHGMEGARDEIMGAETKSESELELLRREKLKDAKLNATRPEDISF